MATIHIPATLDDLTKGLGGIERLLTAKQWERAAIVYAWTDPGTGGPRTAHNPVQLSIRAFAELGITGLRSQAAVSAYRKAWEEAAAKVGNDEMLAIEPGDAVEAPDLPWKDHFGEPTVEVQERVAKAYIAKNPEVVAEAIKAIPAVKEVVVEAVADDDDMQVAVHDRAHTKRTGLSYAKVVPLPSSKVVEEDKALFDAAYAVLAELSRLDKTPYPVRAVTELGLHLLTARLNSREAGAIESSLVESVEDFLRTGSVAS